MVNGQPALFALRQRLAELDAEWDPADRTGQPLLPISDEIALVQAQIEALEAVLGVDSKGELREQIARIEFILANLVEFPGGPGSGARKFWQERLARLRAQLGDTEHEPATEALWRGERPMRTETDIVTSEVSDVRDRRREFYCPWCDTVNTIRQDPVTDAQLRPDTRYNTDVEMACCRECGAFITYL